MLLPKRSLALLLLLRERENAVLCRRRRGPVKTHWQDRARIATIARRLGPLARRFIRLVSPDTLTRWMNDLSNSLCNLRVLRGRFQVWLLKKLGWRPRKIGRPRLRREIVSAIKKIATENPRYGIDRIRGELFMLGLFCSRESIGKILRSNFPDRFARRGESGLSWAQFFFALREGTHAMDFFCLKTIFGQQLFCLFLIDHCNRKCFHMAATLSPSPQWVMGAVRRAYVNHPLPERLISDNDGNFSLWFSKKLREEFGIRHHRSTPHSPWENGVAERFVRTVREDVFDRLPPMLDSRHAERIMARYLLFYNRFRTHLTLDMNTPKGRIRQERTPESAFIERVALFHGLWGFYRWGAKVAYGKQG